VSLWFPASLQAEPPIASFIYPAGGQRGQTVNVRVGGLFLHDRCGFEMLGPGVAVDTPLQRSPTVWFEGPVLPLPDSQQAEDYPRDLAGKVRIAADAPLGLRPWRLWTSQGATPQLRFVVGDLPEIIEDETHLGPTEVKLPITINGRIFPRENVDIWTFEARRGQTISGEVMAARLGSPLDARLEVRDPQGRVIAENDDHFGADPFVRFTAPSDGRYQIRIHDTQFHGGPAFVYRLTLTDGPQVDRTYPLGGRRGTSIKLDLVGQGVPASATADLPKDALAAFAPRFTVDGKQTNPVVLDLDDLPEQMEAEPNDAPQQAARVEVPAVVNGRIDKPGDVDCWAVTLHKGEAWEFDLRAARLGSPLQGVLTLSDATDKQLMRAEGDATGGDPVLRFTAPADGTYVIRVEDRFRSRGGPAFAYRLRIVKPTADFQMRLVHDPAARLRGGSGSDALTLPRGGQGRLRVQAERLGGFTGPIALTVDGVPEGVTVTGTLAANQNITDLTFKADATAKIQSAHLTIRGAAKIGDTMVSRTAVMPLGPGEMDLDSVLLMVALPTPFKVIGHHDMRWAARGTTFHRQYRIERNGFDGPLEVRLADRQMRHLQGVTGPTITVPAGATEFDYAVQLPPWMETGRTCRACVMAVGVVKDTDGSEHTVSFSSVQPNEQIILVIEPERLGLEADKSSLRAAPGGSVAVTVRVRRGKGLHGPARIELAASPLLRGVSAESLTIAADQEQATLTLRFTADARGPFVPLLLRATVMEKEEPVIAETKIEVVGEAGDQ
jgi:hypothetical protein